MEISTPNGIEMAGRAGDLPETEGEPNWDAPKLTGFLTEQEATGITGAEAKMGRTESAAIVGSRASGIANPSGDAEAD
jgi:hypothetical protein